MGQRPISSREIALILGKNGRARRAFLASIGAGAVAISLSSCEKNSDKTGESKEKRPLELYNWDTYIGESTLADFYNSEGVSVNISLFGDNEEMFESVSKGEKAYDIIVPSAEYVERLGQSGFLLPLDHKKIPNLMNIDAQYLNLDFDKANKYSVPYTWAVQGIAYRKSKMKNGIIPNSWKYLFESDEYSGRIALSATPVDIFRMIYKYLGKSINSYNKENLAIAEAILKKQMPHINAFHDDEGQDLLKSKQVDLVWEYNGDVAQAITEDNDIGFVIPKEGSIIDSDCLCIPKNAKSPNNAHALINFMLDASQGANISRAILYPTPNNAAKALMERAYRENPIIFPSKDELVNCEYAQFNGLEEIEACEAAFDKINPSKE